MINEYDYLSFKQCPKSFWLRKNQPEPMVVNEMWGSPEAFEEVYYQLNHYHRVKPSGKLKCKL